MKATFLAEKTGKSIRHIHYILSGKQRASAKLAKVLEEVTGLDRRAWVWPEDFDNPFIQYHLKHKKK